MKLALFSTLILSAGLAQAYQVGDRLQFVGTDSSGNPCAIEFQVSSPYNASADYVKDKEFIQSVTVYSTPTGSTFSTPKSDAFSGHMGVTVGFSLLSGKSFTYSTGSYSPDGFSSRSTDTEFQMSGRSLGEITSASGSYKLSGTFSTKQSNEFSCKHMQPAKAQDMNQITSSIAKLTIEQDKEAKAERARKYEEQKRQEAIEKQKEIDARVKEIEKAQAKREEAARQEPARRAAIDAERAAQGLTPIDWSKTH